MKKVEFELDTNPNLTKVIFFEILRFFIVPYDLFRGYYRKFRIKKTSSIYNLVNYPLAEYIYKRVIWIIIVEYLLYLGLYILEFSENSIIIVCGLVGTIIFGPAFVKFLFLFFVMLLEFSYRITKSAFFTLKSLFTEKGY